MPFFILFLTPQVVFSCIMCIVITCKSTYQFEMMIILETFLVAIDDGKLFTNLCTCVWTKLPKLGKKLNLWPFLGFTSCMLGLPFLFEKKECIIEKTNTCFVCLLFFKWMSAFLKFYWKAFSSYTRPSWHKDTPNCHKWQPTFGKTLEEEGRSFGQTQISSHTHVWSPNVGCLFFVFFCIGNKTLDYLLFFTE
jgi:hypothetical protein